MAARPTKRLTPLEAVIMDAIWELSKATVRQVRDHLKPVKPMAYNTVLTVMRILRKKGFLASQRNGRADVYVAKVSREQVGRRSLRDVLERFFSGSARELVSELLDCEDLSDKQLREIRREVNRKLRGDD